MPYIGRDLNRGNYLKLDDISSSFNSSTKTFNLTVGGSAFTPGSAFSILVSVGGVIQEPESAYQVNNSEITFANPPTAQDGFFCIALGVPISIGVPGNGTVNGTQMAKPFNYDGFFYLNDANNRVGINSSIPTVALDVIGDTNISGDTSISGDVNVSGILTAGTYSGPISNPSGISTFYNLRVTNNLTVEGTTSTLDTDLIGVDRVEVGANSNTIVGVAITQSGTADILRLYDGASQVVTVDDTGKVGINQVAPTSMLQVDYDEGNSEVALRLRAYNASGSKTWQLSEINGNAGVFTIRNATNSVNVLNIKSDGTVGIGTDNPQKQLQILGDADTCLRLTSSAGGVASYQLGDTTDTVKAGITLFNSDNSLRIRGYNNSERIIITSGGLVGIGITNPANVLDVQGTTHTKIHVGTTGTGHATGIQINHAKGNAALQEWQLQTDASADGNLKIRNATSNVDVMFFDADNNNIGINITNPERKLEVVDTAGSLTYPIAVSNHTSPSGGVGAGIAFHLTSGGNTRGELGLVYAGNSNSDGTDFIFRPNDGSTGNVERLRIKGSNGNMGLGVDPVYSGVFGGSQRVLHIGGTTAPGLRIQSSTANQGDFIIQAGNSGGATYLSNLSNNADTSFYNTSGGSTTEKVRIYHGGQVTKPNQPAFNCKLSTATGNNFSGFLVFGSVSYNIGNHYNSSNGRFTVPVDGRYLFTWYTNVDKGGSAGVIWGDWYVNGNARGNRFYTRWDGNWELIGGTIILDLDTNDYVQVYAATSGNWDGGSYGSYSGYLLG